MASGLTLPRLGFVDVAGDVLFPEKKNKQTKTKNKISVCTGCSKIRLTIIIGKRLVINYS